MQGVTSQKNLNLQKDRWENLKSLLLILLAFTHFISFIFPPSNLKNCGADRKRRKENFHAVKFHLRTSFPVGVC